MKASLLVRIAGVTLGLCFSAAAATLYWDGADTSSAADGGSGVWSTSTSLQNWDDAETGGNAAVWVAGSSAVLGGAAGVVTLGSDIAVATATFNVSGYELATAGHSLTVSAFGGSGSFTKSGAGTLLVTGQGSYSGNIVVSGGLLQLGTGWNVLGAYNSSVDKVTVASGATFDVAGFWDINFGLTLAGTGTAGQGVFINSGSDTGEGHVQTPNIALSADATIGGSGNFYMISPGYATNALVLNGHTLTKIGANTFCMVNTTVSAGNVYIAEGGFGVKISGAGASGVAVTLADAAGATLVLNNSWLDIGALQGGGSTGGNVSLGSGDLYVGALNTPTVYAGAISGGGRLIKNGGAALTLSGTSSHNGTILVNSGRLNLTGATAAAVSVGSSGRIAGTGSTAGLLTLNGGTLALPGGATTQSLTVGGVDFASASTVWFESAPVEGATYDILTYGSGTVTGLSNLMVLARGTLTDDTANHKLTFTAAASTRTWNTTTGTWDVGATANWVEGDQLFANGDRVVFGNISADAAVTLSGTIKPGAVTVNNATNQYTFSGSPITGDTELTKTGAGTLLLASENTYVGVTHVGGGTLKMGQNHALGPQLSGSPVSQVVVGSGGTLDFNGIIDAVYGYTISGSGVEGGGALVNNGSAIGNGIAQCSKIRLSADAAIGGAGNWSLLTWGYGPTTIDLGGHTLTKTGTNAIYLCNTTISTGAVRVAAGTLSQTGPGIVNGTNTTFTLDDAADATLALSDIDLAVGALAGGGTNGGVVNIGGSTLTVGALGTSNTFSGAISGWGTLVKTGTNVWVIAGNSANFNGPVVVNGGTLKLGRSGSSSVPAGNVLGQGYFGLNKVTVNAGATLDLAGFDNTAYGFTLAGNGCDGQGALINSGAATSIGNIQTTFIALSADASVGGSGDFYMIGPGYDAVPSVLTLNGHTLTKRGTNTFYFVDTTMDAGTVYIAQGTVSQDPMSWLSSSVGSAATFSLANAAGVTLALNNKAFSVGALAGGGSEGGLVALGAGTLTVGALGTPAVFGGSIDGFGGVVKVGGGEQTFSGVNTYSGPTTVSGGALRVNGQHVTGSGYSVESGATLGGTGTVTVAGSVALQAGATLAPGAAALAGGTLTLSSLTMASTAALAIDHPSDKVVVAGSLALDNTPVTVSDFSLFSRHAVYPILTCSGSVTGSFKKQVGDTLWIITRRGDTFYMLVDSGMLITIR